MFKLIIFTLGRIYMFINISQNFCLFLMNRLPIIQGGSHTFVAPIVAMLTLEQFRCPTESAYILKISTCDTKEP